MSRGVVTLVCEFKVTDSGQLDLGIPVSPAAVPGGGRPGDAEAAPGVPGLSGDDWADQGWIPGDYPEAACADDDAWLASLPPDIRAEFLAGEAWTGDGEAIPAGFLHHLRSGPHGVGFAVGGVLDAMSPGPWLGEAIATAAAGGHEKLGESELIGVLRAWRRMSSWAAAGEAAAVMALARRRSAQSQEPGTAHLAEHVNDELAAALTLTGRSADRLLSTSHGFARLAEVHAALERGAIDWAKACVFISELEALADAEVARDIASRLLGRAGAGGWTTGQLRAALRRAVLAADPEAAVSRREEAEVQSWDEQSGNAALAGRELPPADVIAANSRLNALARWLQDRGAAGTISQLRVAAYTALLTGRPVESLLPGLTAGDSDAAATPRAGHDGPATAGESCIGGAAAGWPAVSGTIHLIMPMSAWLGGGQPGDVAGHGPVDARTSRELAAMHGASPGSKWCLTVTGADGRAAGHPCARRGPAAGEPVVRRATGLRARLQLLDTGNCSHARQPASYQPPASLRNLIMIRQRTRSFPGCRRAAIRCDVDHTLPFGHFAFLWDISG